MATTVGRSRGTSAAEESNIDAFVKATTAWGSQHANCTFAELNRDAVAECGFNHVLFLGSKDELGKAFGPAEDDAKAGALALVDCWELGSNPLFKAALKQAGEGKITTTFVESDTVGYGGGPLRVMIGVLPARATRHNTPCRPDVITTLVRAAVGEVASAEGTNLAVVPLTQAGRDEFAVASAVARGAINPFNAKGGAAETGYVKGKGTDVCVFFPHTLSAKAAGDLAAVAQCVQVTMRLVEAPTNLVDTTTFPQIAIDLATQTGAANGGKVTAQVIRGEELREQGYGGVYGVGKAAEFPPALVTLHYTPAAGKGAAKKKIALVGKGIVYDTGGLAVKTPCTFMCGMKRDMGGAAAVFGGFLAAVALQSPHEVTCTLCLADNAIGPRSFRNDDILRLRSGKTVEINNTDAEGRLVLADGVYHASALIPGFTPDVIMDMATLTGAQLIGVGRRHAAVYTGSDAWEAAATKAGKLTGDTCHPIVYAPEFHEPEFASKVADFRNLMAQTNNAGISCAGAFIEMNLAKEYKGDFVHFDIAGVAYDNEWGATAYGVTLLAQLLTTADLP